MFLQLLTRRSKQNPLEADGTVKDPKNPNAVALLLIPLVPAAIPLLEASEPSTLLWLSAPLVAAAIAVWLLIIGLAAEAKWKASEIAARPRLPAKVLGALALGVTVSLLVLVHTDGPPVMAVTKGVIGAVLALLSFGLDPLSDKGLATISDRERYAVAQKVADIHARLDGMVGRVRVLHDSGALDVTLSVATAVRRLTQAVMLDPKHHRTARRHLGPMFDGAEQGAERFAALWTISPQPEAMAEFVALAGQLAAEFDRAAVAYAQAGAEDLKVEAAVLRGLIKCEAN